jgi:hypothetical protein
MTTQSIVYAEDAVGSFTLYRRPVKRRSVLQLAPGQNQDGYGSKITTDLVVQFNGQTRQYRVYCTCWSNSGSNWIAYQGKRLWLRTYCQDDVKD